MCMCYFYVLKEIYMMSSLMNNIGQSYLYCVCDGGGGGGGYESIIIINIFFS